MYFFTRAFHKKNGFIFGEEPVEVKIAESADAVDSVLEWVERMQATGFYVTGWLSYEASSAFDPAHKVKACHDFPLVWMAAYENVEFISEEELPQFINSRHEYEKIDLTPLITEDEYSENITKILNYIKEGDIYQANYTFRCLAQITSNPFELFCRLYKNHPVPYPFYVDTGKTQILSFSPELFLAKNGQKLLTEPMKGTAARKLTWEEDEQARKDLEQDSKSKAENIMIVDLMRNDFSKICKENTIKTTALFQATRYRSLHQLTGKVHGELQEGLNLNQIMKATFPPGSITGAPKIRSMEIIHELESTPRKVYTGSMCFFMPSGDFVMNVAIRTLIVEKGELELGIGSGIVADSAKDPEWEECFLKSTFLNTDFSFNEIFETVLWTPSEGFLYQDEHIKRFKNSCSYFNISVNSAQITQCFFDGHTFFVENQIAHGKFRISIEQNSEITFTTEKLPFSDWGKNTLRLLLSPQKTRSNDVYLYHKTDHRQLYNSEFSWAQNAGYDEVIFTNERNEFTEGSISNIFFETPTGQWLTPKQHCGLLPGVWRAAMIKELDAKEAIINFEDLKHFKNIFVGNSVKKGQYVESISLKDGSIIQFFAQKNQIK